MNDFFKGVIEKFQFDIIEPLKEEGYTVEEEDQSEGKVTYYLSTNEVAERLTKEQIEQIKNKKSYKDFIDEQFSDFCTFQEEKYDEYAKKFDAVNFRQKNLMIKEQWEKDHADKLLEDYLIDIEYVHYFIFTISQQNEEANIIFEYESYFGSSEGEMFNKLGSTEIPLTHIDYMSRIIAQALNLSEKFDDFKETSFNQFYFKPSNHRIARELIKIAKLLMSEEEAQTPVDIKTLKKGDYFTLKDIEQPSESQVYVFEEYDRSEKQYLAYKFNDAGGNGRYFKPGTKVYVDFTF